MGYVELIVAAISILIRIAEATSGPGTGENKKSFVMNTIESIIKAFARFSTGGQKATWTGIAAIFGGISEHLSKLIDVIVDGLYNTGDDKKPPIEFDEIG